MISSADSSPLLPYGELLSAVSNMTLSDDEMHKLMEVLNQKAGVRQESWQLVDKHSHNTSYKLMLAGSISWLSIYKLKLEEGV